MRLLIFLCSMIGLATDDIQESGTWIIDKGSQLYIYGATNINNFTCAIKRYDRLDTLEYVHNDLQKEIVFEKNKMSVDIENFDCGNPLITKDFKQTLKSDKHPKLEIRFLTLEQAALGESITGKVMITLAGVSQMYSIEYTLDDMTDTKLQLSGKRKVNFADFDLEAPEKLMGLIKVQETLEVEFQIVLRPL